MSQQTITRAVMPVTAMPARTVAVTALASAVAVSYGLMQGWPAWATVSAAVVPWLPAFSIGTARTYKNQGYLALFYVLVVTQTGHFLEHAVQMSQLHVLDKTGPAARGVFGALDIEWVHFTWNLLVFVSGIVLVYRFRDNAMLWAVAVIATWHIVEHSIMIYQYLNTGKPGHPGLLATGGILGGGLPIARPELHFLYNLIETIPLIGALFWQLRHSQFAGLSNRMMATGEES